jgi:5-bromo-4-chloroindolyl phosphate hydrolysis protein
MILLLIALLYCSTKNEFSYDAKLDNQTKTISSREDYENSGKLFEVIKDNLSENKKKLKQLKEILKHEKDDYEIVKEKYHKDKKMLKKE